MKNRENKGKLKTKQKKEERKGEKWYESSINSVLMYG